MDSVLEDTNLREKQDNKLTKVMKENDFSMTGKIRIVKQWSV